jgi:hypothetical protein
MTEENRKAERFQAFAQAVQAANLDVDGNKQSVHSSAVALNFQDGPGSAPRGDR